MKRPVLMLFALMAIMAVVWMSFFLVINYMNVAGDDGWAVMGARGDTFGALNTLLTAFAFAALFVGYLLETKRFEAQELELKNQRDELLENRATNARQSFEQTFFKMLQNVRSIESSMASVHKSRMFIHEMNKFTVTFHYPEAESDIGRIYKETIYDKYDDSLGPYFRSLHHLFKFIDSSKVISEAEKDRYGNLARAGLSKSELILIAENCCNKDLSIQFTQYLVRFRLLKHLSPPDYRAIMQRIFPPETFEARD